ncbi:hypothetical protein FJT64_009488 [Amphibalanus amphitrite]|uniref:Uncharacterized protein n=1 Tax=Amphibalanus amphitrite TaxID=1232801 RepID=A0A6A4V8F2_AMPAM|nr:hypothetical protein FJT64_009488 [Amphibalanus amphitrite]
MSAGVTGPDTVSASFFFEPDDDPQAALRSERDFIEYVLSLPSSDLGSERLRPPGGNELGVGKAKISKWTKVKEAFRWEKAQEIREDSAGPGESAARTRHAESAPVAPLPESKSQDSGLEVDRSRLLQIPGGSRSRDSYLSPSPVDSMLSGGSTGLTPNTAVSSMSSSTASSSEDLTEPDFVRMAREQDDMGRWAKML